MTHTTRWPVACLWFAASLPALAQAFPEGATRPSAGEVRSHLAGQVFGVTLANGTTWRLQYTANGYMFVDTSTGFKGNGEWRTEDGKLCSHLRGRDPGCSEVRLHDGALHLQRDSGEIIRLLPR